MPRRRHPGIPARRTGALALLAAATLLAAGPLAADVFRTLRGRAADRLAALGGQTLHRSEASVNGEPATLTVFGFDGSPGERVPHLARGLGLPQPRRRSVACLLSGGAAAERVHLLTLPAGLGKTLAFLITHRPPSAEPGRPPPWPDDLPRPGGAEAIFSASLAATRTTLVSATVPSPAAAAAEIDAILRGAGWSPAAPATPSFALYQRRTAAFAVLSQPGDAPDTSRITLLQRLGQTP